ncbi:MAG: hypothetical protein KI791_02320 [Cyclobacteriaceae bacterium]|nr:hypothetical protein [Cyclobacteriaceae bacterium SS2]
MNNHSFLLLLALSFSYHSKAQIDVTSLDLNGDVTEWFDKNMGLVNLPVTAGSHYAVYYSSTISHQFFSHNRWLEIKISYSNQVYTDFFGLYDVESDILLLRHPLHSFYSQPVNLNQEKVNWFTMDNHYFKYYEKSESPEQRQGFYDELYMGENVQLIVKRKKIAFPSQGDMTLDFRNYDAYFLKRGGTYNQVSSRRSIIKELWDHKKELRRFIRKNMLRPKKGYDQDIVSLLEYYDSLMSD